MALAAKGISRQDAHEEIRVLSQEAATTVKVNGGDNDLMDRIRSTAFFAPVLKQLDQLLDPKTFIGRAPEQVTEFIRGEVGSLSEEQIANMTEVELAQLEKGEVEVALQKYREKLKDAKTESLKV